MQIEIHTKENVCVNCKHYIQHYISGVDGYVPCNFGHCLYPRIKSRKPGEDACKYFKDVYQQEVS